MNLFFPRFRDHLPSWCSANGSFIGGLTFFGACFLPLTFAQKEFSPQLNFAISETWRWNELEDLSDISTFYGASDPNDTLWLPNYDGIFAYDGNEITRYPYPKHFSPSFPNRVHCAKDGKVYVSTEAGLRMLHEGSWKMLYDYDARMDLRIVQFAETENGILFVRSPNGLLRIENEEVTIVDQTSGGIISVLINDGDLWYTTIYSNLVHRVPLDESYRLLISEEKIYELPSSPSTHRTVLLDTQNYGLIAICNDNEIGLLRYDEGSDSWFEFAKHPTLNTHDIVVEASDGSLVTHNMDFISVFKNGNWRDIKDDHFNPYSFPFIINNRSGIIIGGFRESTYYVDTSNEQWESYSGMMYQCEDKTGRAWFLNYQGKVIVNNPSLGHWHYFNEADGVINLPLGIHCSSHNLIWVYGSHNGTAALSILRDGKWRIHEFPDLGSRIGVHSAYEYKDGTIYFGSGDSRAIEMDNKGGVLVCKIHKGILHAEHITTQQVPAHIVSIVRQNDTLWLGGENFLKYENEITKPALVNLEEETTSLWVDDIIKTTNNELWVCQRGLGVLQIKDGNWIRHAAESGLNSNYVIRVIEDRDHPGSVYALTNTELLRFDGESWGPSIFELPIPIANGHGSMFQSQDGSIWINSYCEPWRVRFEKNQKEEDEKYLPHTYTIRFKPRVTIPETRILSEVSRYNEPANVIINWEGKAKWSTVSHSKLTYSYRLNNGGWSQFEPKTQKILFNLKGGDYLFEVRTSDHQGNIDPTPAQINFRVTPPKWKNPWIISGSTGILLFIIVLIIWIVRLKVRHLLEIEQVKVDFFSHLSHELRTPLTLIIDPIESVLADSKDPKTVSKLKTASDSVNRLMKLVDQLLDFRKINLGKVSTPLVKCEVVSFISSEIDLIRPLAQKKKQSINFESPNGKIRCLIQQDKLETILDNLLSNAIKYTNEHGEITVSVRIIQEDTLNISVTDNGIGLSKEQMKQVFDPFFRGETSGKDRPVGSGLGMSLVKKTVESIGGQITVSSPVYPDSTDRPGSRFDVSMPIQLEQDLGADQPVIIDIEEEEIENSNDETILLLVEDNLEIREYISDGLSDAFRIETAENGAIGYEKAKHLIPDIIISDVLMPETDGYELCALVKRNDLTSHIPFIILTALKSNKHEAKGFDCGADEFINKPVRLNVLKKRLRNVIKTREAVIERFAKEKNLPVDDESISNEGKESPFTGKLNSVIVEHMADHEFKLDEFAKAMAMSKMSLHRKLKALTGESPASYLKTMRLKHAAKLLLGHDIQVSEVMEQVGFLDMSHFSASFKKQFGLSPSQYSASRKDNE